MTLLTGPVGIGKSSVAAAFCAQIRAQQAIVLTARATHLSAGIPYSLWVEALQQFVSQLPPDEAASLVSRHTILDHSLPPTAAGMPEHDGHDAARWSRVRYSLAALLAELTSSARVCVAFDDSHLADPWSWDALYTLSGRPAANGLFVIVSGSRHSLFTNPHAGSVLTDLENRNLLCRLDLEPLPAEAIGGLIYNAVGVVARPDIVQRVTERTAGNPFLTTRLLRDISEGDQLEPATLDELPISVLDGVRSWFTECSPPSRNIIDALAVSRRELILSDLARVTHHDVGEIADQLHALVQAGLISESRHGSHWYYQLAHPVVAEAIYGTIGGARRALIHREIGGAFLVNGDVATCAKHLIEGADAGDDEIIAMLLEALEKADRHDAYQQGLELLGALRDLLPHGDDRWASVAEALAGWAFSHHINGDARLAIAALREIEMVSSDSISADRAAEVKARLSVLLAWSVGELAAANKAAREAIELYEASDMASHVLFTRVELAYIQGLGGNIALMAEGAKTVLADAEECGDTAAAESALGAYATAIFFQGQFAAADDAFDRALILARRSGSPNRLARNLANQAWGLIHQGQRAEALAALEQARITMPWWTESNLADIEAGVRWLAGDLTGATSCLEGRDWSHPTLRRGMGSVYLILAHVECSETQQAHKSLKIAERLYRDSNWFVTSSQYYHAAGMFAWLEAKTDEALALVTTAADRLLAIGAPAIALPVLIDQVELACEIDETDVAIGSTELLRELATESGLIFHKALAALALAQTGLATGDDLEAILDNAVYARDSLRELDLAVLHGRATHTVARVMKHSGRAADTVTALRDAASIFHECGALWRRDRAADELRKINESGRRAAAQVIGPEHLTRRELEVAKLAAKRLPAREIAERLFVSRRTVESHIASVYNKLGVHSKAELSELFP